jgi:hypothetical protein
MNVQRRIVFVDYFGKKKGLHWIGRGFSMTPFLLVRPMGEGACYLEGWGCSPLASSPTSFCLYWAERELLKYEEFMSRSILFFGMASTKNFVNKKRSVLTKLGQGIALAGGNKLILLILIKSTVSRDFLNVFLVFILF